VKILESIEPELCHGSKSDKILRQYGIVLDKEMQVLLEKYHSSASMKSQASHKLSLIWL